MAESLMGSDDSAYDAPQFTEEQINKAYRMEFCTREFWIKEENVDILQAIVDSKFSAHPGSEFEADVEYYSNPRLVVYCLACNVELRSYENFIIHVAGKPHKKRAIRPVYKDTDNTLSNRTLQPISKGKVSFPENSLEYDLQRSGVPVIGMSFIFKECYRRKIVYSCQLCNKPRLDHDEMFKHLTGDDHAREYLAVKFQKRVTLANLPAERALIHEREGGVNFSIPDFSSHLQGAEEGGSTTSLARFSRLSLSPSE
ncbi:uncharacterized protein LOC122247205 [Penaeus japonicus]|uniref:uncharacterized protein LOC122247205 n=1 Tax=Penaeus japonicus TaxID=27405 RepID=UPI001C71344F|nr:uncharacterized protein LOC122247205 [Penaeus japonicus]